MAIKAKPLVRYPGSKAKKCETLMEMIPSFKGEWYEPFGGSSVVSTYFQEMYPDKTVHINDLYTRLYNLYLTVRDNVEDFIELATQVREDYPPEKTELKTELFEKMGEWLEHEDQLHRSVGYYVRNKISFSGMETSPTDDAYRDMFNLGNLRKTRENSKIYQSMIFTNLDYREFLKDVKADDFVFLDPPYDIKDMLYGKKGNMHKGFDHQVFSEVVKTLPCKWLITYNDNETLREYFKDYNIYDEEYLYSMAFETDEETGEKKCRVKNELIITNYERYEHKATLDAFFG